MDRACREPPCSLSTPLSESRDYLCETSLPDSRFLTIYWPLKRGNVRGPNPESIWTGSSSSLTHSIVTNEETVPEYRTYISSRQMAPVFYHRTKFRATRTPRALRFGKGMKRNGRNPVPLVLNR